MKVEFTTEEMKVLMKYLSKEDLDKILKAIQEMFKSLKTDEKWRDHVFLPGFSPKMTEYVYNNYEPQEQDVFIASYPKTGTNWTAEVVRQILYQDEEEDVLTKVLPRAVNMIEMLSKEGFAIRDKLPLKRYLMVTHLPATLVNVEKIKKGNAKVIYVMRNPKDQLVSFYNFLRKLPHGQIEPLKSMLSEWDKFFDHMVAGDFPTANKPGEWYPDHILSWYQQRDNNKTIYFLCFEDMKKDLCKEIQLLSKFLDVPMSEEKARSIAKSCSFDEMKKEQTKGDSVSAQLMSVNMRKGQVGGWKDHLTVRQSERVDEIFEEKFKDTDLKFTYEL